MTTPQEIPLSLDTPLYNMRVTLDGQEYILDLDYSERESRWYLSISGIDGKPLIWGRKIVCNWPLLRKSTIVGRPAGEIFAIDNSPMGGEPPTFQDLGRRVRLVYYPAS